MPSNLIGMCLRFSARKMRKNEDSHTQALNSLFLHMARRISIPGPLPSDVPIELAGQAPQCLNMDQPARLFGLIFDVLSEPPRTTGHSHANSADISFIILCRHIAGHRRSLCSVRIGILGARQRGARVGRLSIRHPVHRQRLPALAAMRTGNLQLPVSRRHVAGDILDRI